MKPIIINENEKERILGLHKCVILEEQEYTGKTISDIQKLVGAKDDNYLGPETLQKIQTMLALPDKPQTNNTKQDNLIVPQTTDANVDYTKVPYNPTKINPLER